MGTSALEALFAKDRARIERDRLLARAAFEAIWERDLGAGTFRWTAGLSMFGYLPAEVADDLGWWAERIHPDDRERVLAHVEEARRGAGASWTQEYRFRRGDGSWGWVTERGLLDRDARSRAVAAFASMIDTSSANRIDGASGVALEVAERARDLRGGTVTTELSALEENQRLLKLVLEMLPVGVLVTDKAGNAILGNAAAARIWGRTIVSGNERWQRSAGTWRHSGKPVEQWASARALLRGETSLNELIDIEALDGARKTIQNSAVPIRNDGQEIIGALVVNEDVTERVRAEEALRKSQQRLIDAQRLANVGSWERDLKAGTFELTDQARRIFLGDTAGELRSDDQLLSFVHPDDRERVRAFRERYLQVDGPAEVEYRVVRADGSVRWVFGHVEVVRGADGEPLRASGTMLDHTERKRGAEELERRLRQQAAVAQLGQSALGVAGDDLQKLFEQAVDLIVASSDFDFADVAELMPDATLVLRSARGWKEGMAGRAHLPANTGSLCALALATRAPALVEDIRRETRIAVDPVIFEQGIVGHVAVLIQGEGQPFGTLGAGSRLPRAYTQHDVNFVQSMANLLASAVERGRAATQLREQREQLRALSRKLLAAQEAERRAVARELHDDFGQVLTTIKLNLQLRERDAAESIALVDGAIARMRDLVLDLRPPLLDELGLESSLRWYVEREASRAGLEFHLALATLPSRPSPQLEATCFRVAQEALTNIIRHAQAKRVEIELRVDGSSLVLEVRDDGKGFDLAEARKRAIHGHSQGLLSMQERVALAGGVLEIDSAPGRGTTVRARVPLGPDGAA